MKTLVAKHPLIAALILSWPLIAQAQTTPTNQRPTTPANTSRTVDRLTLLRGPGLLSPATTAKPDDEARVQQKISDAQRQAEDAQGAAVDALERRVIESSSSTGEASRQDVEQVRTNLERLKRLQAERAAALQRKKEFDGVKERSLQQEAELKRLNETLRESPSMPLPKDPVRFDGRMPELPKSLVPKSGTETGTMRFESEAKP